MLLIHQSLCASCISNALPTAASTCLIRPTKKQSDSAKKGHEWTLLWWDSVQPYDPQINYLGNIHAKSDDVFANLP